jgi:hypothetical protein
VNAARSARTAYRCDSGDRFSEANGRQRGELRLNRSPTKRGSGLFRNLCTPRSRQRPANSAPYRARPLTMVKNVRPPWYRPAMFWADRVSANDADRSYLADRWIIPRLHLVSCRTGRRDCHHGLPVVSVHCWLSRMDWTQVHMFRRIIQGLAFSRRRSTGYILTK